MKVLILSLTLFSTTAFAGCELYKKFGEPVSICWKKELRALMSEKCQEDCLALTFLKKGHPQTPSVKTVGGKNPATEKCKYYQLNVIVIKDPRGAEQSFCEFSDESLVDSNAFARSLK